MKSRFFSCKKDTNYRALLRKEVSVDTFVSVSFD